MKKIYNTFLILIIPFFSFAQTHYLPGYAVTLKGDTLHGFIDYREWDNNPSDISFKNALNDSKPRKLSTDDINSFNVNGLESYQKYTGPISTDEINVNRVSEGRDSGFRIAAVFLRILQKGRNVCLYQYSDAVKTRYYIGEQPGFAPKELEYKIYNSAAVSGTNGRTISENTFLKQLFTLCNTYNVLDDKLVRTIETSDYSKPAIMTIVSRINNISKTDYEKKYTEKSPSYFYAGVGANIASIIPQGNYLINGGKSHTSVLPKAVAGINIFANPNTQKLAFRLEVSVAASSYSSNYDNKVVPYVNITYSYSQLTMAFTPYVIYNFYNADNLKYYLGAGMSITYNQFSNKVFTSKSGPVQTSFNPFYFYSGSNPIVIQTGILLHKKIEVNLTYLTKVMSTEDAYFQMYISSIQIGVNYFFGGK